MERLVSEVEGMLNCYSCDENENDDDIFAHLTTNQGVLGLCGVGKWM